MNVVLATRNLGKLEQLMDELPSARTLAVKADISLPEDCRSVAEQATSRFGGVNALINNAFQFGPYASLIDATLDDDWWQPFDVNVKGTVRMVQAALPALKASRGSVVMVNTVAARIHKPGAAAYALSKSALQTATRTLAVELAQHGVRVNAVFPGYIDGAPLQSAFAARAQAQQITPEQVRRYTTESLPLKYIPTDDDVAEAVIFLAGEKARAITGASLDVNAGEYMPL